MKRFAFLLSGKMPANARKLKEDAPDACTDCSKCLLELTADRFARPPVSTCGEEMGVRYSFSIAPIYRNCEEGRVSQSEEDPFTIGGPRRILLHPFI